MVSEDRILKIASAYELYGKQKTGELFGISGDSVIRYYWQYKTRKEEHKEKKVPNVLLLDIETAPIVSYSWDIWNVNIGTNQIISDWFILTWACKWLFEAETYSDRLTPQEALKKDDKRLIKGVWELINQADVVITQNGRKFDHKKLNTRFLIAGLKPPMPYIVIDTLEILKKNFAFTSNKLDYVNKVLGLNRKIDTGGFELWEECMRGEKQSLQEMEQYNRNDVGILEELYVKIRAWHKSHPNMNLFAEGDGSGCPVCQSKHLSFGDEYITAVNRYRAFRCNDCGAICRAPKPLKRRENALISIAR